MSKSMLGSLKSISNGKNINNSAIYKPDDSLNKSHRIIQSITKKNIPASRGKDLLSLFEKDKTISESGFFTGSDISAPDDLKVRIKNKKYYEMISNFFQLFLD